MVNILANFIFYGIKVICFGAIAYLAIILGKKYRDKKSAGQGG